MFFNNEWSKQIFSGGLTATMLFCATIGMAQEVGIVFTLGGSTGAEIQPSWWASRNVISPDKSPSNPSLVNVGQLKWMTRQLHEELSTLLPPEANLFALNTVSPTAPQAFEQLMPYDQNYTNWITGNQSAASLGQVKNCAYKFYDALNAISTSWVSDQLTRSGHPSDGRKYPWTLTEADDLNKAAANIGQLKSVFSLRLRESLDGDLLPDIFELALIKYNPAFARKTIDDITWNPGDATISLKVIKGTGATNTIPTDIQVPNLGGSQNGALSASALLAEHQPVGSVGGSFSVGGDGSANYSVPINIPKGTSGVEPQIALTYSSSAGNGALGVGFDISGFQRITRGATDRLKDNFTDPVDFDDNDRFFLDGELLIATHNASGAPAAAADYGKAGTVYQTENNSFARIVSHGQTHSGPTYWTVQTKAGLTIEIGNTESSRISKGVLAGKGVLVWNVNKVKDNVGNFYTVTYQHDQANSGPLDYRLAQVHYTGNDSTDSTDSTDPYNEIHFQWENRPDVATSYIQGVKVFNQKRLHSIEIKSKGSILYYYELGYTKNLANNASQLTSLTRCIDANNKMPPTKFNWAKEALPDRAEWTYSAENEGNKYWETVKEKANWWGNHKMVDHLREATQASYLQASSAGGTSREFMDMNGDGLLDRVASYDYGSTPSHMDWPNKGGIWVALNTGNGFARATRWWTSAVPNDNQLTWMVVGGDYNGSKINGFYDLNGDGLLDRVTHYNYNGDDKSYGLWVSLNTGSGFEAPKKWWSSTKPEDNYPEWYEKGSQLNGLVDINGDGLLDRFCHMKYDSNGVKTLGLWVSINTGHGLGPQQLWSPSATEPGLNKEDSYLEWSDNGSKKNGFMDVNGDGLPDRVSFRNYATGARGIWVSLNSGVSETGFSSQKLWSPSITEPGLNEQDSFIEWNDGGSQKNGFMDVNGDGLPDRVSFRNYTSDDKGIWVSINDGKKFGSQQSWLSSLGSDEKDSYLEWNDGGSKKNGFIDANGDGLLDRMSYRNFTTVSSSTLGLWISINTGSGFASATRWYTNSEAPEDNYPTWIIGDSEVNGFLDLNGDGLIDRIQNGFFDRNKVHLNTGSSFNTDKLPQDLGPRITSVVDGLGAEIKVEYKRGSSTKLDDAGRRVYTPPSYNATEAGAGIHAVNGAGYLVSRYAEQDGLGGYRWKRHYYGERKVDRINQVDLGFKWIETIDEQSGAGSISINSQQFPYQGRPLESLSYLKDGNNLILTSKENYTYEGFADIPGIGGKIRFSYQKTTTSTNCVPEGPHADADTLPTNLPGNRIYRANILSTATHTNDAFDSFGNLLTTTTSSDGFTTTSSNVYASPVTNDGLWIHGRLSSATVTKTGPAGYDPITKTSTFTYYPDGPFVGMLKTEIAEPSNATAVEKSYQYDKWGNKASTTIRALNNDQPPRTSYVKYDASGRFPVEEWNDLNHKTTHFYDHKRSLLLGSTGANGLTTRYFYDAWGTRILTRGPDGSEAAEITRYAPDNFILPGSGLDPATQKIIFIRKSQATGSAATTAYLDAQGRVLMSSAESFDGRLVFSRHDYDVRGRGFRQSQPFFLGDPIRWSSVEFDLADRPWKNISPDNSFSYVSYQGFTTIATNSVNRKQTRVVNAQGWLTSALDNDGNVVSYTYTVDGKPNSTTAPGSRPITTVLDVFGQKTSMTDPNVGTSSTDYYSFGEVEKSTDATGATTHFTYDILGRKKTRVLKNPNGTIDSSTTWTYDTAPGAGIGQIHKVEMKDAFGTTTYLSSIRYDSLGRPTETTTTQNGETFRTSVTYDTQGRPRTETDAGGLTILHEYNARGFKSAIRDYLTGQLYWKPLQYDASGRLVREELGNGVVNKNTYDQDHGFLLGNEALKGSTVLQNMEYKWDDDGTFRRRSDLRANLSESFDYDSLNRLEFSQVTGKAKLGYTYHINGNIRTKAKVGTYSYDSAARPHAVTSIAATNGTTRAFEYDANGAFTREKRNGQDYREVTWAAHQNVKEFKLTGGPRVLKVDGTELYAAGNTTTTFDYDAGYSRSKKVTERDRLQREITSYLGSYERIVSESRANPNVSYTLQKIEHRHSIGGLALKTFTQQAGITSEETVYYLKDHLGSLTATVDAAGVVKERYSFDAWGSRRDAATWSDSTYDPLTKTTATNRGYTGHEMLDELGIVHMNGRLYDPEIGRVLSGDPVIQDADDAQNFNRYSYVLNNPLSYSDPSGFFFKKLFNAIGKFFSNIGRAIGNFVSSAWKKVTKWLAENEWAMIVVTIIVGIVSMGVGLAATATLAGASLGVSAGIGAVLTGSITTLGFSSLGLAVAGGIGGAIAGGVNAALAGGDLGDIFKGALIGGIQGAASAGIGHSDFFAKGGAFGGATGSAIAQTTAHGILGGTVNEAMGGKFQDGFLSAAAAKGASFLPGVGEFLSPGTDEGQSIGILGRTALAATIGGTASAVGGGKFANGAKTAAMQHLFNEEALTTGVKWLMPDINGSKVLPIITENDSMGRDLLEFPEVKEAMLKMKYSPELTHVKWSRSLANESKLMYVLTFNIDMVFNRTRALVGSINGIVLRQSDNLIVQSADRLGLASATHLPPIGGRYGASILKNDLFGSRGVGGDVWLRFNVNVYSPRK
jgi:RHS repeat-associated protein